MTEKARRCLKHVAGPGNQELTMSRRTKSTCHCHLSLLCCYNVSSASAKQSLVRPCAFHAIVALALFY